MRISDWSSDVCSSDLFGVVILAALAALPAFPAQARATVAESALEPRHDGNIPAQLGEADRARYRAIFAALHNEQWTEAKNLIELGDDDIFRPVALAELYPARNSPRVELLDLPKLPNTAPSFPTHHKLPRLA